MPFDVGDKVVYPHHGAAVIERRERRDAFGTDREYLVLKLAYGDLTLMVPADNTDEVGLREVINDEEGEEVFAVLRKKEARMPTNWSRRSEGRPRRRYGSASSSFFSASSSVTLSAKVSSDTRIWRAFVSMRFSPAERPLSFSRRERFRTTSATW